MIALRTLEAEDLRLLNKSTVSLLRALLDYRGPEGPPFVAELSWLAHRAGLKIETARKSLKRLRAIGCVQTERTFEKVPGKSFKRKAVHRYTVLGELRVRKGTETISVPEVAFLAWSQGRQKQGRPRKQCTDNNQRTQKNLPSTPKKITGTPPDRGSTNRETFSKKRNNSGSLAKKDYRSTTVRSTVFLFDPPKGGVSRKDTPSPARDVFFSSTGTARKALKAPTLSSKPSRKLSGRHPLRVRRSMRRQEPKNLGEPSRKNLGEPSPTPKASSTPKTTSTASVTPEERKEILSKLFAKMQEGPPSPPLIPPPPEKLIYDIPRPDPPFKEFIGHARLDEKLTPRQQVMMMVRAFNDAHLVVFGKHGKAYRKPESVLRSKLYPHLKKAAEALVDKGIPPQSWCEWRMQWYADKGKDCPPINAILGHKQIRSKSGWFRKDYDRPDQYKSILTREHKEQLYRFKEALRYNRGFKDPLLFLPRWYRELREDEIEKGITNPIQNYPRLRAGSGSRRVNLVKIPRSDWEGT